MFPRRCSGTGMFPRHQNVSPLVNVSPSASGRRGNIPGEAKMFLRGHGGDGETFARKCFPAPAIGGKCFPAGPVCQQIPRRARARCSPVAKVRVNPASAKLYEWGRLFSFSSSVVFCRYKRLPRRCRRKARKVSPVKTAERFPRRSRMLTGETFREGFPVGLTGGAHLEKVSPVVLPTAHHADGETFPSQGRRGNLRSRRQRDGETFATRAGVTGKPFEVPVYIPRKGFLGAAEKRFPRWRGAQKGFPVTAGGQRFPRCWDLKGFPVGSAHDGETFPTSSRGGAGETFCARKCPAGPTGKPLGAQEVMGIEKGFPVALTVGKGCPVDPVNATGKPFRVKGFPVALVNAVHQRFPR